MTDGAGRLNERLQRLEALLRAQGAPFVRRLQPGPAADQVTARLVGAGIAPLHELVTWFGWHDGTGSRPRGELLHRWRLLGIDEALRRYASEPNSPMDDPPWPWWPVTWLPFATDDEAYLVIDVGGDPGGPHAVHHCSRYQDPAEAGWPHVDAPSLADFVDHWVRAFESGSLYWDPERSRWEGTGLAPGTPGARYLDRTARR